MCGLPNNVPPRWQPNHQARQSPSPDVFSEHGFTLLEITVAFAIASILLVATYATISSIMQSFSLVDQKGRELSDILLLRRTLQQDLLAVITPDGHPPLTVQSDGFSFLANGRVVPKMQLGPMVTVTYRWEKSGSNGVVFRRQIASQDGKKTPLYEVSIDNALSHVTCLMLDQTGWQEMDRSVTGSIRALRWNFSWKNLGDFEMLFPFGIPIR